MSSREEDAKLTHILMYDLVIILHVYVKVQIQNIFEPRFKLLEII